MAEVVRMQLAAGITKFKAATIAEAELTAAAGAAFVLVAHPLVGPKVRRLADLQRMFPSVQFATLVDNPQTAAYLNAVFTEQNLTARVLVDVNNGMNRTGHLVNDDLFDFYRDLSEQCVWPNLNCDGLHVYDGHFRQPDFAERKAAVDAAFAPVAALLRRIEAVGMPQPMVICGGTPSFTCHAGRETVYLSPGTCLLWDWGYGNALTEQPFEWAALLLTRVISKPKPGYVTLDLGHKAVASENPLANRVRFLNLTDYEPVSQSEEHLVLSVRDWDAIKVGDVLYGVPYHICPTVNLYNEVYVAEAGRVTDTWQVVARNRRITI
jgi:D-serine deaminase-like pyridoxal phosphate-dependent protein